VTALDTAQSTFLRVMDMPAPADLWELQKALLVIGGEQAMRARATARAFHGCLRGLESKSSSRSASRWGAALGTAAVASVSVNELADEKDDPLTNLVQSGVPALLEVGSALKSAQAWEVEAVLVYDDVAWYLYDELWDVSQAARPELTPDERSAEIDRVLGPLLDPSQSDGDRNTLAVHVFQAVLAARMLPLLEG
jgi:hypothetical protein